MVFQKYMSSVILEKLTQPTKTWTKIKGRIGIQRDRRQIENIETDLI